MALGLLMHVFWVLKVQWQCKILLLKPDKALPVPRVTESDPVLSEDVCHML